MRINVKRLNSEDTVENLKKYLSKYEHNALIKSEYSAENLFLSELNDKFFPKYGIGIVAHNYYLPKILLLKGRVLVGFDNNVYVFDGNLLLNNKKTSISPFYDFVSYLEHKIIILIFEIDIIGISAISGNQLWKIAVNDIITNYKKLNGTLGIKTFEGQKIEIDILNGNSKMII